MKWGSVKEALRLPESGPPELMETQLPATPSLAEVLESGPNTHSRSGLPRVSARNELSKIEMALAFQWLVAREGAGPGRLSPV